MLKLIQVETKNESFESFWNHEGLNRLITKFLENLFECLKNLSNSSELKEKNVDIVMAWKPLVNSGNIIFRIAEKHMPEP